MVRAIAECTIPVISAVGHETDTTLSDYAADRRAPTPTAAAEIAVPVKADLDATLADFAARQRRAVYRPVELGRERLEARVRRLPKVENLLQPQAQRLDELSERLRRGLTDRAAQGRERLAGVASRLSPSALTRAHAEAQRRLERARLVPALVERPLASKRDALAALARLAEQLHPEKPLDRGYAIVRDPSGKALTSKRQAEREAALKLQFKDDVLDVTVGGSGSPPPRARARAKAPPKPKSGTSARQEDLFD